LLVVEAGVAPSEAGLVFGGEFLNCTGLKTSYLVDHFRVFSYPGHETFLFLHWRHEGAVSSHLSCMVVSRWPNWCDNVRITLLSLQRPQPLRDLVFFALRSRAVAFSWASVGMLSQRTRSRMWRDGGVERQWHCGEAMGWMP
jgi:hypothetical protein